MGAGPGLARSPREAGLSWQQVEQVEEGQGEIWGRDTSGVEHVCTRRAGILFKDRALTKVLACVVRFPFSPGTYLPTHCILVKPQSCRFPTSSSWTTSAISFRNL